MFPLGFLSSSLNFSPNTPYQCRRKAEKEGTQQPRHTAAKDRTNMDGLQNSTADTSFYPSVIHLSNLSFTPSNLSIPLSPALPPLDLHQPLPAIIITLCLFLVFGGCVSFLAVCRCSQGSEGLEGGCGGDGLRCGQSLSSEPQLKLWKRLGSVRRSFYSAPSFRRPPQPSVSAQDRLQSKVSLQLELDRRDPQAQLTLPCLLQYATEI